MTASRTSVLTIRTPEGIEFPLRLASPVSRFLAWSVDLAAIAAAQSVVAVVLRGLSLVSPDTAAAVMALVYFALSIGYGIALEWLWRGQTLGKRVVRLRVMDERGLRLRFPQVVVRNLLRFVDSLPLFYLVGGCAALASRLGQRLGDFAAGTIVVRVPRTESPDVQQITAGRFNSFRLHPHLEARLRQRISPAEASIALQAVLRRDELEPAARLELFRELADSFRRLVPMPPETAEDLTDEQYVRNVLDTVYRRPEIPAASAGPAA